MTTYYYSWTQGLETNDGLSPAKPRRHLNKGHTYSASNRLEAGDSVMLAAGDTWPLSWSTDYPYASASIQTWGWNQNSAGSVLGVYDAGLGYEPPIIDQLLYLTPTYLLSNWGTPVANVYPFNLNTIGPSLKYTGSGSIYPRVWPGMLGPQSGRHRSPLTFKANLTDVVADGQYAIVGNTLHVYSSGGINPAVRYGGLAVCVAPPRNASGDTPASLIVLNDPVNFRMEDRIALRGGESGICLGALSVGTNNLRITAAVESCMNHAVYIGALTNKAQRNIYIPNLSLDYFTSLTEGHQGLNQDGIAVTARCNGSAVVENVEVVDYNCRGARHAAVAFQIVGQVSGTPSDPFDSKRNFIMRASRPGASVINCAESNYGRALAIGAANFRVSGISVVGQNCQSQVFGSGSVRSCSWTENRSTDPGCEGDNFNTANCIDVGPGWGGDRLMTTAQDIEVSDCLFVNPVNFAVQVSDTATTTSWGANACRLVGNTIIDLEHYAPRYLTQTTAPNQPLTLSGADTAASIYVKAWSTQTAWPVLTDNLFVIPAGRSGIVAHANSGWTNVATVYGINAFPAGKTAPIGNVKAHSLVAAGLDPVTFRPHPGAGIAGTATPAGVRRFDCSMKLRPSTPSIGAYEPA